MKDVSPYLVRLITCCTNRVMSAEEKVIAIKDVMERARKDWREAQMQVMNLYTEIENDMSVITPNLSGMWIF